MPAGSAVDLQKLASFVESRLVVESNSSGVICKNIYIYLYNTWLKCIFYLDRTVRTYP